MASLLASLGSEPARPAFWLALLFTYAGHALVWTAIATYWARRSGLSPAAQHSLWKAALLGPILTALIATLLASSPSAGVTGASGAARAPRELAVLTLTSGASISAPAPNGPTWRESERGWRLLTACAFGASAFGVLGFCGSAFGLRSRLHGRRRVCDARLLQRLDRLRQRFELGSLELTESPNLASPLVIGMAEICLPEGLLQALTDAEADAVLAHELAHLERRDGVWFPFVALLQAALWLQPTNHWVVRRFRQTAELACDDRATELTADPLALASALVHVAERAVLPGPSALVPTMASGTSSLVARVTRLTTGKYEPSVGTSSWARWCAIGSLVVVGALTASVNVRAARLPRAKPTADTAGARAEESAPDAAAASAAMAALARREHELSEAVQRAAREPGAEEPASQASVRELELGQELEHVRATEAWREQRFADDWAAWQARRSASAAAVR